MSPTTSKIFKVWERLLDRYYRLDRNERIELQVFFNELRNLIYGYKSKPFDNNQDLPLPEDLPRLEKLFESNPILYEGIAKLAAKSGGDWLLGEFGIVDDTGRGGRSKCPCPRCQGNEHVL